MRLWDAREQGAEDGEAAEAGVEDAYGGGHGVRTFSGDEIVQKVGWIASRGRERRFAYTDCWSRLPGGLQAGRFRPNYECQASAVQWEHRLARRHCEAHSAHLLLCHDERKHPSRSNHWLISGCDMVRIQTRSSCAGADGDGSKQWLYPIPMAY